MIAPPLKCLSMRPYKIRARKARIVWSVIGLISVAAGCPNLAPAPAPTPQGDHHRASAPDSAPQSKPVGCLRDSVNIGFPCPPPPRVVDYELDGVTGEGGTTIRFPQSQVVRVVVHDVNPFLFSYDVQVNDVPLGEPSPVQFFGALPFGFQLPLPAAQGTPQVPTTGTTHAGQGVRQPVTVRVLDCPDAPRLVAIRQDVERIFAADRGAATELRAANLTVKNAQKDLRRATDSILDARSRAPAVNRNALRAAARLDSLVPALEDRSTAVEDSVASIRQRLPDVIDSAKSLAKDPAFAKCTYLTDSVPAFAARVVKDTTAYTKASQALESVGAKAADQRRTLQMTVSNPQQFYYALLLERYTTPTDVKLSVRRTPAPLIDLSLVAATASGPGKPESPDQPRDTPKPGNGSVITTTTTTTTPQAVQDPKKPAGDPPKTDGVQGTPHSSEGRLVTQVRLNFGGASRFVIAAGLIWTDIASRQYSVNSRLATPTPAQPSDTIANVIGDPTVSRSRVTPMLTLNTRVYRPIYATIGAGLRTTGGTELDYVAGSGFSAFDERVLVTGGFYFGQASVLAGGLHVGDRLPAQTTTVPTRNKAIVRFGLGVSYRLLPVGSLGPMK
jgi:hypothetical protein